MDYDDEEIEERRPSIWLKGVERMNTYQILKEVDRIMAHNPKWKPYVHKYKSFQFKTKTRAVNGGSCSI